MSVFDNFMQDIAAMEAVGSRKQRKSLLEELGNEKILVDIITELNRSGVKFADSEDSETAFHNQNVGNAMLMAFSVGFGATTAMSTYRLGPATVACVPNLKKCREIWVCVLNKNDKPRVYCIGRNAIGKMYDIDTKEINHEQVMKYAKHIMKHARSSESTEPVKQLPAAESEIAMEGFVNKLRNRAINVTERAKTAQKYKSVKDLIDSEQEGGHKRGVIDGIFVDLYIEGNGEPLNAGDYRKIGSTLSQVAACHKILCQTIVDQHNESQGKNSPWAWSEDEGAFHEKKISDVSSKIQLSCVELRYYDHTTPNGGKYKAGDVTVDMWYNDGGLWYGHAIIVYDAVDPSTGKAVKDINYEIAG